MPVNEYFTESIIGMPQYTLQGFHCIACGSNSAKFLYSVRDTNQGVAGEWDIVQCAECGLARLWPMPNPEEIAAFYEGQFYTEEGERFAVPVERIRAKLAKLRGRTLNKLCPQRGRLMDFGSGAGHFAIAQQRKGWEVHAVDPYSTSPAQDRVSLCVSEDGAITLDYPAAYFDAITLWYVLEHLADPVQVLGELCRVLKTGGCLLIAVQDFSGIQARVFGPHWLILDPPRHLWHFSPENLDLLAEMQGMRRIALTRACIELGPYTIMQSILNRLLGNRNYLFRFLKNRALTCGRTTRSELGGVVTSLALIPILGPLSLLLYWGLLSLGSGDVFMAYYQRKKTQ